MPRYSPEQLANMARLHLSADRLLDWRPHQVSEAL